MAIGTTLRKLRNMDIEIPRDPRTIEALAASGLCLTGLALGGLVHRRFRLLAFGACGLMAASAFGFSPLSWIRDRSSGSDDAEADAELEDESAPREKVGVPAIAAMGVPHRIPEGDVGLGD